MSCDDYEQRKRPLQIGLLKLQCWVKDTDPLLVGSAASILEQDAKPARPEAGTEADPFHRSPRRRRCGGAAR